MAHPMAPPRPRRFSGAQLRRIRRYKELTQAELAAAANIPLSTLRGYEQGRINPSTERLAGLAYCLMVPETRLFENVPC